MNKRGKEKRVLKKAKNKSKKPKTIETNKNNNQ